MNGMLIRMDMYGSVVPPLFSFIAAAMLLSCGTAAKRRFVLVVDRAYVALWRVSPGLLAGPGPQAQPFDQLKESVEHLVIADLDVN